MTVVDGVHQDIGGYLSAQWYVFDLFRFPRTEAELTIGILLLKARRFTFYFSS